MTTIEADYLVVGAGASGMAFVDSLIGKADADVVLVDRRHRPGGHWNDDYPFVRLHQPSSMYGVVSRPLGTNRLQESGTDAGFYERATAAEICDYYGRVLDEDMLPSGKVRFLGRHDYLGPDGDVHVVRSLLSGATTRVRVRKRLVDATYLESSIPSRHTPSFAVDPAARLLTPNDLVALDEAPSGFTVIGAGKTAMDTCVWLIESGVDPERIRWVKPRDGWITPRAALQGLSLVASFTRWLLAENEAGAEAENSRDYLLRLEDKGGVLRIDPDVEPTFYRGPILNDGEVAMLRTIGDVVRKGRVRRVAADEIELEEGTLPTAAGHVYVDCTAAGLATNPGRPIFDGDRITIQSVQMGIIPFSAALIGLVEAIHDNDGDKNRLCPANAWSAAANSTDAARSWAITQRAVGEWSSDRDVNGWLTTCRLSAIGGAGEHFGKPEAIQPFFRAMELREAAVANLERIVEQETAARAS